MSRSSNPKVNQSEKFDINSALPSSLKRKYLITIIALIILSVLNISLKFDKVNTNVWSFSIELKVTSITLILVFLLWLPVLLPWVLSQSPQLRGSLNWLREQGIEEVETNLLRIKLRYGVQEASRNYEEKIWNTGATNTELTPQESHEQIEKRYREAINLVDAASTIDSTEALKRIDQLANYYDKVREEMPAGSERTRLMREISSTLWALVPKAQNFPVRERLNSDKGGERLSAYKYIEWQPEIEHLDLLLSRAIGVLEVPFGQYSALLALRRVVTTHELKPAQAKEITHILNWATTPDYIKTNRSRRKLMSEIVSIIAINATGSS